MNGVKKSGINKWLIKDNRDQTRAVMNAEKLEKQG
jgi:hypothetical protein